MPSKLNVIKIAQLTGHNASIFSVTGTPDPAFFLSGGGDGWIVRWDLRDPDPGRLLARVQHQVFSLCMLRDRPVVIAGDMNGGVHWVYLEDPESNRGISHHRNGVFGILEIGRDVYTIGGEGRLTRWEVDPARSIESLQLSSQPLRALDYSSSRNQIAVGSSDNCIYLVDAETLELKETIAGAHQNSVFAVRFHPDGRHLLSGGRDAYLRVWDLDQQNRQVSAQPAHWFTINSIDFDSSGRWFATGSRDKTVKIWDAENFSLLKVLETVRDKGHLNSINELYWSPFRDYLVTGSDDRSLIIWEIGQVSNEEV